MEMMFVMGKRTRSRCQATGSAAPVPMAANTSAEAGPEKERPTRGCSLLGGPHHPTQRGGVAQLLPHAPAAEAKRGDGALPPPLPAGGSLPRGRSSEGARQGSRGAPCPPTAPWRRSVGLPAAVSVSAARRPLRVTPRQRSGDRRGGRGAPRPPSARILRRREAFPQVCRKFGSPARSPLSCPRCRAGTTQALLRLPAFQAAFAP